MRASPKPEELAARFNLQLLNSGVQVLTDESGNQVQVMPILVEVSTPLERFNPDKWRTKILSRFEELLNQYGHPLGILRSMRELHLPDRLVARYRVFVRAR